MPWPCDPPHALDLLREITQLACDAHRAGALRDPEYLRVVDRVAHCATATPCDLPPVPEEVHLERVTAARDAAHTGNWSLVIENLTHGH